MTLKGNAIKMRVEHHDPIHYFLRLGDEEVLLNDFIGKKISLSFNGQINCIDCGRLTSKSFGQGFCYPCFMNSPMNAECIIRPELCEAHLGKGRDVEWEKKNHLQPHTVYLALSSGLKVGVTRNVQIPTRWIDQGASKAIRLAEVPNRHLAGRIEVELKDHMSDKTAWQRMLKNEIDKRDILSEKKEAGALLSNDLQEFVSENDEVLSFEYPVTEFPKTVKSIGFDKFPTCEGIMQGIKGQYLLLDGGRVLNIRKHSGYYLMFQG